MEKLWSKLNNNHNIIFGIFTIIRINLKLRVNFQKAWYVHIGCWWSFQNKQTLFDPKQINCSILLQQIPEGISDDDQQEILHNIDWESNLSITVIFD